MLGRFLEFSIATPDIRASLDFYSRLGFSQAQVGEAWTHPYAVVTDGRIYLGLHQEFVPAPAITFVKPDLLRHSSALERLGLQFEFRRLGNDVFNELGWLDPSGHLIRLVEARTFSPSKRLASDTSLCGYFLEIALPAASRDEAKDFWEKFGFVGIDEPDAASASRLLHQRLGRHRTLRTRAPARAHAVVRDRRCRGGLGAAGRRRSTAHRSSAAAVASASRHGVDGAGRNAHSGGLGALALAARLAALS